MVNKVSSSAALAALHAQYSDADLTKMSKRAVTSMALAPVIQKATAQTASTRQANIDLLAGKKKG